MSFSSIMEMVINGLLPSIVVTALVFMFLSKKYQKQPRSLCLFIFYFCMLFYVTIYRYGISVEEILSPRFEINILPFYHTYLLYINGGWLIFLYNLIGNILWFVPLGMFVAIYGRQHSFQKILCISLLSSLSIELMQYLLNCGISDIDDVIFNTLGGLIGYTIIHHYIKIVKN